MQIVESELKLIIAALRSTAMEWEKKSKLAPTNIERNRMLAFAQACGDLSDKLDNGYFKAGKPLILN